MANEYNLAFTPELAADFPEPGFALKPVAEHDSRLLFHKLIHLSENYDVLPGAYRFLRLQLQQLNQQYSGNFILEINPEQLAAPEFSADIPTISTRPSMAQADALVHAAPVFVTEPAWLAGVAQTAASQAPLAVGLTRTYLNLSSGEQSLAGSREVFSGYLFSQGRQIPDLPTMAFVRQDQVCTEAFTMAAMQLALGQFPRLYFAEILGYTLAYCASPNLMEHWLASGTGDEFGHFLAARAGRKVQERRAIVACIQDYLKSFKQDQATLWRRIQSGFLLYRQLSANLINAINERLNTRQTPKQAAESLILSLLTYAAGHHGRVELMEKSLDNWFTEKPFKSDDFFRALLSSPYVDSKQPENSKLLKLFAFEGPMFGVLDKGGINILQTWLESEFSSLKPGINSHLNKPVMIQEETFLGPGKSKNLLDCEKLTDYGKLSNRQFFYYLVNAELFPRVLSAARTKARRVLNLSKWLNPLPFKSYTHQAFEVYIKDIYLNEANSYQPLIATPKLSKAAYVWGIEQFAPTILTDGSWLQGAHQLAFFSNHAIGAYLDKIYHDECGQGVLEQNHPFIYKTLLDSQGIKLPPIFTREFSEHRGFIDSAFDIPVFLMAIAKFPSAFLPEILGLNMAIELSGLGKVYLRLSQELRYWGIDSAIVDVHISIDNLASGHSALAIKAIETYLDEISATCGNDIMQAHWQRIYSGYCALQTVSNRFKFSLIGHYFFKRPKATKNDKKGSPCT